MPGFLAKILIYGQALIRLGIIDFKGPVVHPIKIGLFGLTENFNTSNERFFQI